MISEKQLIQYFSDANPWWTDQKPPAEYSFYRRQEFNLLKKDLTVKPILSLLGLRRVGKTVILKQLIGHLLKEKRIKPKQILFFNFEEGLIELKPELLEKVLYAYFKLILEQELPQIKQRVYIFLDEIQYIPFWQGVLKRFYDLNPNLKFIISGSASLFIRRKSQESLAGRIFSTEVPPLNFREYLILSEKQKLSQLILPESFLKLSSKEINNLKKEISVKINQLNQEYLNYILQGQFPEPVVNQYSPEQIKKYVQDSIIKKILEYDLPKILAIDNPAELVTIFNVLANETGNILEYQNIAQETNISQVTVKKYINYLTQAFLTSVIYNFSKSLRPKKKYLKKHYAKSTNFSYTLFNLELNTLLATGAIGHLVETQVFNSLSSFFKDIEFWHRRGEEIDFIIQRKELVEVKYSAKITPKDYKVLLRLMDKFKLNQSYLLTREDLDVLTVNNKKIILLPACLMG